MCCRHQPNVPGISGLGMMCLGMACLYAPIIMDREASSNANSPVHVKVNDLANVIDKESVNRIVQLSNVKSMAKPTVYAMPWVMPNLLLSPMPYMMP